MTLKLFFLSILLGFSTTNANANNYYLAVKTVMSEVRPNPMMNDVDKFLKESPNLKKDDPLEKNASIISDYIFKKLEIAPDNTYESREQKDNILPDSVLKYKKGHCVGLTTLFLLIAEKNQLEARLVRAPEHVFPRLCDKTGKCLNIETLSKGSIKEDEYYIKNLLIPKSAIESHLYLASLSSTKELMASLYLSLGFVANKSKQKDLAQLLYLKSAKNSEKFAEPYLNLGGLHAEMGRWDESMSNLKKALEINPYQPTTLINLGAFSQKQNKYEEALSYYNKALEINPLAVQAYRRRAVIYESKKDYKKAVVDLDRILIVQPHFCDVIEDRLSLSKLSDVLNPPELSSRLTQLKSSGKCLALPK